MYVFFGNDDDLAGIVASQFAHVVRMSIGNRR